MDVMVRYRSVDHPHQIMGDEHLRLITRWPIPSPAK
jgi:hypothetical protein